MPSPYQIRLISRTACYPKNELEEITRANQYTKLYGDCVAGMKAAKIERRILELLAYEMPELDAKIRANMAARTRILLKAERTGARS